MRFAAVIIIFFILAVPVIRAQVAPADSVYTGGQNPSMDDLIIDRIKHKPLPVQAGLSFFVSNPQDSLRSAMQKFKANDVGYGFGLYAGYSFDPVPIILGGEFAMSFFGGEDRDYVIPNQIGTHDTVKYRITNFHMPLTIFSRFQPSIATWVYPYAELVGGWMLLSSSLSIEQTNGEVLNSDSESQSSGTWMYGVGAGLMIKFADIITLPNTLQRFLVEARIRYMKGSAVEVPSINISDTGGPSFTVGTATVNSPTLVFFNVGISAQF